MNENEPFNEGKSLEIRIPPYGFLSQKCGKSIKTHSTPKDSHSRNIENQSLLSPKEAKE